MTRTETASDRMEDRQEKSKQPGKSNAADRPRVLVLSSTFPRWENDTEPAFVYELSRRLTPFFDVTVLSPRTPGSKAEELMAGMKVIRFPYFFRAHEKLAMHGGGILSRLRENHLNYLMVPFFLIGQLIGLVRLLRQEKFDLIHAHWIIPQGLIASLGLVFSGGGIPLLCTSHGGDLFALRNAFFRHLKRWIMHRSQALTVVSRTMKNTVIDMGVAPEKIQVISMGVDLINKFTPNEEAKRGDNKLLFVGRLVEVKGLQVLLKAMPMVLAKKPDVYLTVAGGGPMEFELRELANKLGIANNLNFLGMVPQDQLPELYRKAALAVFPFLVTKTGIQEGFGLVVVEAMGCGCPVIAGDLPAIHDSISHEESGLLVLPGNPEILADTIVKALNDPDLNNRLARTARMKAVEQFDWTLVAGKYAGLYKKLIGRSR